MGASGRPAMPCRFSAAFCVNDWSAHRGRPLPHRVAQHEGNAMKSKFALMTVLWLAIGGTVMATARPEPPTIGYPPTPDETEARLQRLELLVNQQQLQIQSLGNENQTLRSNLANMVAINDYVTL